MYRLPCGIEQHGHFVVGQSPKMQVGLHDAYAACPLVLVNRMFHALVSKNFFQIFNASYFIVRYFNSFFCFLA